MGDNDRDSRPPVWVGHVRDAVPDVTAAVGFWQTVGMRLVHQEENFAVMELRGGTHVVVRTAATDQLGEVPFDVMVDDLEASRKALREAGLEPSPVTSGGIHSSFTIIDPAGRPVTVNSSHVVGPV